MKKLKYAFLAFMTVVMLSNVMWAPFSIEELRMFVVKLTAFITVSYSMMEFMEYVYEEK